MHQDHVLSLSKQVLTIVTATEQCSGYRSSLSQCTSGKAYGNLLLQATLPRAKRPQFESWKILGILAKDRYEIISYRCFRMTVPCFVALCLYLQSYILDAQWHFVCNTSNQKYKVLESFWLLHTRIPFIL